jgi:uncharacterized Fe-S radical SAM superfamily protein PflX
MNMLASEAKDLESRKEEGDWRRTIDTMTATSSATVMETRERVLRRHLKDVQSCDAEMSINRNKMAGSAARARDFLEKLRKHTAPAAQKEYEELHQNSWGETKRS